MSTNLINSDGPSVFAGLSATQKQALAYPSPLPPGIAGLIFDWTGKERLELRSDATDSYTEDNTAIHDQIALTPERFTLDASTAEVIFSPIQPSGSPPQPANPLPLNGPMRSRWVIGWSKYIAIGGPADGAKVAVIVFGLKTTNGADVYPVPPAPRVKAETTPAVAVAVAVAPVPPPPVKEITGLF